MLSTASMAYVTDLCGQTTTRSSLLFHNTTAIMPCDGRAGYFDPVVLNEIILPNGQKYKFQYTSYGEVARIDYPTGAYEKFTYDKINGLSWDYQQDATVAQSYGQANRGVVDRYVGADDVTTEQHWHYAADYVSTAYDPYTFVMTTTMPDNTISKRFLQRVKRPLPTSYGNFGFDTILAGMEMETQTIDANGQIRARNLFEWATTDGANVGTGISAIPQRNAKVKREVSIVFDPSNTSALATLSTTDYDETGSSDPAYFSSLNVKEKKTYDYIALGSTTAQTASLSTIAASFSQTQLAGTTETDYLYDANYKARNIVGLASDTRVLDKNGVIVAKSHIDYDQTTYLESASITTAPNWENPNTAYRGLPTTVKTWTDTANNLSIETHTLYDQFGNVRKTYDGKGNISEIQYTDNFTDSINRNSYALPTLTISAVPGGNGSTTAFQTSVKYDFNTGLPVSTTDANSQTTQMDYTDSTHSTGFDPLLRIKKVTAPNGHQTTTEYGAGTSVTTRFVKVRMQIDATNWKESCTGYDGLGRTVRTQTVDTNGNVFVDTQYDAKGRVWKVSNPYRTGETVYWTENTYDFELGRLTKVKTPDNAEVNTAYSLATTGSQIGTAATVTDQASKQRRSITNGLGQLVRVDEPDDSSSTGYLGTIAAPAQPTVYAYDPLNNLKTVTQTGTTAAQCGGNTPPCTQTRSFVYDSLSRLKMAINPESGLIQYGYDNNGNLQTKIDARSITTTFAYDNLNRVTSRTYSGEPVGQETPAVTYFYDNLTNAKGKLIKVSSSISTTEYTGFDTMGRVTAHKQTTDGVAYTTAYGYNLAGALLTETYPSSRVVKNVLDADGDLSIVQSKKNSLAGYWNYAQHFTYTSAGAVSSMQLGNGKWESTVFNSRLQPTQIALGTIQNGTDNLKLNYTYNNTGQNDNNGNVLSQQITVPTTNGAAGFTATQNYTYDSLNRLKTATETIGGNQSWKQTFTYDRFGNRRFDTNGSNTTTLPTGCQTAVCNPQIDPLTNKLVGYSFDNAGNMTVDASGKTFAYDGENKQTKVMNGTAKAGEYFYDGDGKRVKKIEYDQSGVEVETTVFVYDASGKLVAEYSTNPAPASTARVSYLTNDNLGSPRATTGADGKVFSRRDFMPFGEEITSAQTAQRSVNLNYGNDSVRQKFTSYERDNETNLDYAKARMFGSGFGRFTSPDPLLSSGRIENPQTWNRYIYVLNSPMSLIDPDGLYECKGTDKQCEQFAERLAKAKKLLNDPNLSKKQKSEIERSLGAYGTLNDKNGLTVMFGKLGKNEDGRTNFPKTNVDGKEAVEWLKDNGNGEYVPQINVTLADGYDEDTIAHEGSHAADRQELIRDIIAQIKQGNNPSDEAIMKNPLNIRKYYSELRAYLVSASVNKANGIETKVWQKGWNEADKRTISAINSILKSESVYKLSPEGTKPGPGTQILEFPK